VILSILGTGKGTLNPIKKLIWISRREERERATKQREGRSRVFNLGKYRFLHASRKIKAFASVKTKKGEPATVGGWKI